MKIKKEHYDYMKAEIMKAPCSVADHRQWLKDNAKVNDLVKRLRWDFFNAARLYQFASATLYAYCNDDHIDTALKNIIKEIDL